VLYVLVLLCRFVIDLCVEFIYAESTLRLLSTSIHHSILTVRKVGPTLQNVTLSNNFDDFFNVHSRMQLVGSRVSQTELIILDPRLQVAQGVPDDTVSGVWRFICSQLMSAYMYLRYTNG
jgi:hypothetical protein